MKIFIDCTILAGYPSGGPVYLVNLLREIAKIRPDIEIYTGFKGVNLAHRRRFENMVNSLVRIPISYKYKFVPGRVYVPQPRFLSHYVDFRASCYDVIHFPASLSLPSTYFDSFRHAVLTIYDAYPLYRNDHLSPQYRVYWRKQLPVQARKCGAIITISQHAKRDLCQHLDVDPDKIFVIPLAVQWANANEHSISFSDILTRHKLNAKKYFLAVGSLRPNKNYLHLIRAFTAYQKSPSYKKESLVVVGNRHRDDKDIYDMIKFNPAILLIHGITESELRTLYNQAMGFFMISEREGFGIPLLEAMSCGCPACYSQGSAMEEIGRDAAFSVVPDDIQSVSEIFRRFAEGGKDIDGRVVAGREIAREYSWERTTIETLKVYDIARNA